MNRITIKEINDYSCSEQSEFIFTTKEWINFLTLDKKGAPLVLEINIDNKKIYFVSLLFKKIIKMCGSPFEGWSTPYMGFINIKQLKDEDKYLVIKETVKYLKHKKYCWYIQICDWNIDFDFVRKYKLRSEVDRTYFNDISKDEESLFMSFKNDVRTNHRAFERNGLRLILEKPSRSFMDEYYKQLIEVFDKRNLKPHYDLERMYHLSDSFEKSEGVFVEKVFLPEEDKCIATGIFLIDNKRLYFFGAASYREYHILRPNEEVIWNAIRYAKQHGCTEFDMMGLGKYKEKFKPVIREIPVLYFQKLPFLHFLKEQMKKRTFRGFKK